MLLLFYIFHLSQFYICIYIYVNISSFHSYLKCHNLLSFAVPLDLRLFHFISLDAKYYLYKCLHIYICVCVCVCVCVCIYIYIYLGYFLRVYSLKWNYYVKRCEFLLHIALLLSRQIEPTENATEDT